MESARVRLLIEAYFEGETSLLEEQELQNYFINNDVAPEFKEYTVLFSAFAKAKKETSPHPIQLPDVEKKPRSPLRWTTGVAAAIVVSVGLYINRAQEDQLSSSYETEEMAILKTKQALGIMSQMLAKSTAQLEVVNEFDKASSTLFK